MNQQIYDAKHDAKHEADGLIGPSSPNNQSGQSGQTNETGQILWLTLNRPERRNALTAPLVAALQQALAQAAHNPALRAVVLTGAGETAFCSGADLRPGSFPFDFSQPYQILADLMRQARRSGLPIIGRINGLCLAGGMGLLALCDLVVASEHAVFGLPEAKVGLFPVQVLAELQALLPRRILNEMCFGGRRLSALEAQQWGLINHVAAGPMDLDLTLNALLEQVLAQSPAALRRGLYTLKHIDGMSFEAAIAFSESQLGLFTQTADFAEGVMAFAEKRPPNWPGR
jgi:enoyl-CoA hydratase/carnithine racemase